MRLYKSRYDCTEENATEARLFECSEEVTVNPVALTPVKMSPSRIHFCVKRRKSAATVASSSGSHRGYDFTKAQTITPDQLWCVSGKVNSADKLYLVIESVKTDAKNKVLNPPQK
jgi:hypothetical protein